MTHKGLRDCRNYYIYVVLSQTQTRVGGAIRKLARIRYNHAAIAFDSELKQLYSFARRQYKNPLDAGLVREHPEWYSLRRFDRVDVRIYKIPVTRQQYLKGKSRILEIRHDADGYLYNLFSVLFFPFLKGFETYKAYSCAEFVAHMLRTMNIELAGDKLACAYTPQEIGERMGSWLMYEGNLLDYCQPPARTGFLLRQAGLRAHGENERRRRIRALVSEAAVLKRLHCYKYKNLPSGDGSVAGCFFGTFESALRHRSGRIH